MSASACFILTLLITNATGQPRTTIPVTVSTATMVLFRKYLGIAEMVSGADVIPQIETGREGVLGGIGHLIRCFQTGADHPENRVNLDHYKNCHDKVEKGP